DLPDVRKSHRYSSLRTEWRAVRCTVKGEKCLYRAMIAHIAAQHEDCFVDATGMKEKKYIYQILELMTDFVRL
ncbi:hypothetical protein, partial [Azospirillum sp. TSH64]|uniref:hypothetical protein n=1 Tax=Azospirillum sp. TSH64 TaxID=652740 RepID=UPI001B3BBD7A